MSSISRAAILLSGLGMLLLSACGVNSTQQRGAVSQDPSRPNVASIYYYISASLLHYQGDYASAAELYKRAREQDPHSLQIRKQFLISSASAYLQSQMETQPILELYDNSREFIATDPDLLNTAYSVYNQAEKPEGVAWTVSTLIAKFPSSRAYLQQFLTDYQLNGKPRESFLKQAYKLANGKSDELLMIAKIYTLADPNRSIEILKEIRAKGDNPEATKLLGEYSLQFGYYGDADDLFTSLSYPADRNQMLMLIQQANKSRACKQVLAWEAPILSTQDAELMGELSLAAYLESAYDSLNRIYQVLERKYSEPPADAKIAVFLVAATLDSTAMHAPEKYLSYLFGARDADDILLYRTLHLSLNNPPDTEAILKNWEREISTRLPRSLWSDYLMAATRATSNADSLLGFTRIALCESLCDGIKGYDSDYSYLLNHYHQSNMPERKFPLLRNALKRYPDNPLFLNDLGYSLLEFPDSLEAAGKLIARAVEMEPENAYYQDSAAWYYYLKGDYPLALEHIQIPLSLDSIPSEIAYHIGMILVANGNPDLAKAYLKMAADDDQSPDYQAKARSALDKLP